MPLALTACELEKETTTKPRILIWKTPDESVLLLSSEEHTAYLWERGPLSQTIPPAARTALARSDIVLLDITRSSHTILKTIQELVATIGICNSRPRLLCFSAVHRNPEFVFKVQKSGARYVRLGSLEMLYEAIDLLIAETLELEHHGPHFEIVHRFSNGVCSPGEEIAAILLEHDGDFFQLPLGLVERLVFDLLAQRRLAVDSLQIVSGLAGDWFYREHGANSGYRQFKKVRRLTIKVSIQRIRDAMASVLGKLHLGFDPYQVLRSCSGEGTNRVLYKLCARISWRHPK
jgi:hypothetical protein